MYGVLGLPIIKKSLMLSCFVKDDECNGQTDIITIAHTTQFVT